MCAASDIVFETHFEFWRGIRLHDAERLEAARVRLFREGRLDRGRIFPQSRSAYTVCEASKSRGRSSVSMAAGPRACRRGSRETTDATLRVRTSSLSLRLRSTALRPNSLQMKDATPLPGQQA